MYSHHFLENYPVFYHIHVLQIYFQSVAWQTLLYSSLNLFETLSSGLGTFLKPRWEIPIILLEYRVGAVISLTSHSERAFSRCWRHEDKLAQSLPTRAHCQVGNLTCEKYLRAEDRALLLCKIQEDPIGEKTFERALKNKNNFTSRTVKEGHLFQGSNVWKSGCREGSHRVRNSECNFFFQLQPKEHLHQNHLMLTKIKFLVSHHILYHNVWVCGLGILIFLKTLHKIWGMLPKNSS